MKTIETKTFYEPPKVKALEVRAHGLMCQSRPTATDMEEEDYV